MKRIFYLVFLFVPVILQAQIITTVAGNGTAGFSGDGGLALNAQLNNPSDVFKDGAGNIYIADNGNNRIRKINTSGIISTIAGNGAYGYAGDGGAAIAASLNHPNRVVVDNSGNIYIADEGNSVIRMINTSGIISTIAGTGIAGYSGDEGLAINATLNDPTGVAVDNSGNVYISDRGNFLIRKTNSAGIISTYAGGGAGKYKVDGVAATSISLCGQNYVSVDQTGTVYITNHDCWHFLKITTAGLVYNVAGNTSASYDGDGGSAFAANIEGPAGICPDNLGNIYLCAQQNVRVRKVDAQNNITTLAGTGVAGYSGDGGIAANAQVSETINGIYADATGIYFADMGNNRVRYISATDNINGKAPEINVYPNPAQNELIITSSALISNVRLIDLLGQTVYIHDFNASQVAVDVSGLAASMYIVSINGKEVRKFVKE